MPTRGSENTNAAKTVIQIGPNARDSKRFHSEATAEQLEPLAESLKKNAPAP